MKASSYVIICRTSNNAGKDMWLRAHPANQNLKPNVQTQAADGKQATFLLYMTQLEAISQQ